MKKLGIILICLGIGALLYTGFSFTTKEKLVDLGPLEINKQNKHTIGWPGYTGAVLVIAGLALVILGKK